ncbi:MAG: hypothetical protein M1330_00130, partial [Armatimonadetes bacterium]|nr:hypothetical protein [Armatimonadota bacterium]
VNQPKRQPGELPKPSVVDTFTDTMGKVFTPKERVQQRQIAHYLKRLSVALQEQDDLEGWKSAKDAADACVALFGRERTNELRETLGYTARNVLDVAIELGYTDE